MNFNNIIGNEQIEQLLEKAIENNTITHSYLFIGPAGIGKKIFAKEFAKAILCLEEKEKPCNKCKSCIEYNTLNHPDYYEIDTEENSIKIDDIRMLQTKILEKPIISNKKIYIINDSEKMTKEAQNCLLKTLEEPPEYITIILITSNESNILNTIKSRCTKICFNPIENEKLKQYLTEKGIEVNNEIMLKSYSGSIKKALEMNENKEIYEELNKYFENIENYNILDVLNKIESLYKNKEKIIEMLEYINIILFEKAKKDLKYINYIKYVEEAKQKIKLNSNYDMTIDNLLIKIFE